MSPQKTEYYNISKGLEIVVFSNDNIQIRKGNKTIDLTKKESHKIKEFITFLEIDD